MAKNNTRQSESPAAKINMVYTYEACIAKHRIAQYFCTKSGNLAYLGRVWSLHVCRFW